MRLVDTWRWPLIGCIVILSLLTISNGLDVDDLDEYLDDIAVLIEGGDDVANLVALNHKFTIKRKLPNLGNYYILSHADIARRSKRSADDFIDLLKRDPSVTFVEQQKILKRQKRSPLRDDINGNSLHRRSIVHDKQRGFPLNDEFRDPADFFRVDTSNRKRDSISKTPTFNDPRYSDQWQLVNTGQATKRDLKIDLNVMPAWKRGVTGKGVVVSVLDDGVEKDHPDIKPNFDAKASIDLNQREHGHDPTPDGTDFNSHGTKCAGEIAAAGNNGVCGVGVAYEASIGGVRMLDGVVTDALEAEAIIHNFQYVHIYSASWGPTDDGKHLEAPKTLCSQALRKGAEEGRGGLGNIYIWATGNGGSSDDTCSCDGYVSSIYTLAIGSLTENGLSTYYSEICPATIAVVPTGGQHNMNSGSGKPALKITTTNIDGGCTSGFEGTSAAAPLAAGCVALTLQANPGIGWRDVQHIVVRAARITSDEDDGNWIINGARFHVNDHFGFGYMDCGRMVHLAQNWTNVGPHHQCTMPEQSGFTVPDQHNTTRSVTTDACDGSDNSVRHLEHVQLIIKATSERRGNINIFLTSPQGTRVELLRKRENDNNTNIDFTFMSVHTWGEDPRGNWTIEVQDRGDGDPPTDIELESWQLILWGSEEAVVEPVVEEEDGKKQNRREPHEADQGELKKMIQMENGLAQHVTIDQRLLEGLSTRELEQVMKEVDTGMLDTEEKVVRKVLEMKKKDEAKKKLTTSSSRSWMSSSRRSPFGPQSYIGAAQLKRNESHNQKRGNKEFDDLLDLFINELGKK